MKKSMILLSVFLSITFCLSNLYSQSDDCTVCKELLKISQEYKTETSDLSLSRTLFDEYLKEKANTNGNNAGIATKIINSSGIFKGSGSYESQKAVIEKISKKSYEQLDNTEKRYISTISVNARALSSFEFCIKELCTESNANFVSFECIGNHVYIALRPYSDDILHTEVKLSNVFIENGTPSDRKKVIKAGTKLKANQIELFEYTFDNPSKPIIVTLTFSNRGSKNHKIEIPPKICKGEPCNKLTVVVPDLDTSMNVSEQNFTNDQYAGEFPYENVLYGGYIKFFIKDNKTIMCEYNILWQGEENGVKHRKTREVAKRQFTVYRAKENESIVDLEDSYGHTVSKDGIHEIIYWLGKCEQYEPELQSPQQKWDQTANYLNKGSIDKNLAKIKFWKVGKPARNTELDNGRYSIEFLNNKEKKYLMVVLERCEK